MTCKRNLNLLIIFQYILHAFEVIPAHFNDINCYALQERYGFPFWVLSDGIWTDFWWPVFYFFISKTLVIFEHSASILITLVLCVTILSLSQYLYINLENRHLLKIESPVNSTVKFHRSFSTMIVYHWQLAGEGEKASALTKVSKWKSAQCFHDKVEIATITHWQD